MNNAYVRMRSLRGEGQSAEGGREGEGEEEEEEIKFRVTNCYQIINQKV
jgi:hypothetical protein